MLNKLLLFFLIIIHIILPYTIKTKIYSINIGINISDSIDTIINKLNLYYINDTLKNNIKNDLYYVNCTNFGKNNNLKNYSINYKLINEQDYTILCMYNYGKIWSHIFVYKQYCQ